MRPPAPGVKVARATVGGVRSTRTVARRSVARVAPKGPPLRTTTRTTWRPSARPPSSTGTMRRPGAATAEPRGSHSPASPPSAAALTSIWVGPRPRALWRLSVAVRSRSSARTQAPGTSWSSTDGGVVSTMIRSGAGVAPALPAPSAATTRHAWTPSGTPTATAAVCGPGPVAPASVSHAPAVEPSPAALTWAELAPAPLRLSATDQCRLAPPPGVAAAASWPAAGGVRSRWITPSATAPPVPSPSTSTATRWTPSPMPSSGSWMEWSPTPGAPAQRTWPATDTRWRAVPSVPKLSAALQSTRAALEPPAIQPGVRWRRTAAGGATSRTNTRGLSMK